VSEVVGALLLIVVVVTAVASLSYFVASAQQQAQNRQAYLTNVHDDNLQVAYASFSPSNPSIPTFNTTILTVRNTNTLPSGLDGIEINGIPVTVWTQVNQTGFPIFTYGANQAPLQIPAEGSVYVYVNFTAVPKNAPLEVVLQSTAGNFFTTNYYPGTPIPGASISTRNYQGISQDILTLDGSKSYVANSSIVSYQWQIALPTSPTCTGFDAGNSSLVVGETIQYIPSSNQLKYDCVTGPIQATLTITNGNGFISASPPILIPSDPDLDPTAGLSNATCTGATTGPVAVKVTDVFGRGVPGVVVTATRTSGDVTTTQPTALTDSTGTATFTANWTVSPSSVEIQAGTLPPIQAVCG
jgi:hypothetical protein